MASSDESKDPQERANDKTKDKANDKGMLSRLMAVVTGDTRTQSDAPRATDLLKKEHDEVRDLFKQFKAASEGAKSTKERVIREVCAKLDVHAQQEEKIFYPACRSLSDAEARRMVAESLEEHLIVKRLIKELASLSGSDERFQAKATVLMEAVEHHAGEEERDLFPAAEKELEDERLEDLGRKMAALKARLTRGPSRGAAKSTSAKKSSGRGKRSSPSH